MPPLVQSSLLHVALFLTEPLAHRPGEVHTAHQPVVADNVLIDKEVASQRLPTKTTSCPLWLSQKMINWTTENAISDCGCLFPFLLYPNRQRVSWIWSHAHRTLRRQRQRAS